MIPVVSLIGKLPVHPMKKFHRRPLTAIKRIVVHHTAAPVSQTPEEIARYHVEVKDWPGIGYSYLISPTGIIYKCWPATMITACVEKGNTPSLCVCLIGDFTQAGPPSPQWTAAVRLVRWLKHIYPAEIFGHREVPTSPPQSTACPGAAFDMRSFRVSVSVEDDL